MRGQGNAASAIIVVSIQGIAIVVPVDIDSDGNIGKPLMHCHHDNYCGRL
jgi:hypothetical protein